MATCDVCGNDFDKTIEITVAGATHTFDSFECAIQQLAPRCAHCGVTIVGHGIEGPDESVYCCAHCARKSGVEQAVDRV